MRLSHLLTTALLTLTACQPTSNAQESPTPSSVQSHDTAISMRVNSSHTGYHGVFPEKERARYAWLASIEVNNADLTTLSQAFAPPEGFKRVAVPAASFGAWLRGMPLLKRRRAVRSYAGQKLSSPGAAIVPMDLGRRDLQQCADSILRLHGEYLWSRGKQDDVKYHFTSGDLSTWREWRKGERFRLKGRGVERIRGKVRTANHDEFVRYLRHTFRYAGTMSMRRDSTEVDGWDALKPGDFMVSPGSPGHAVLILDIAQNDAGKRVALVGQGFMPAQDFHVVHNTQGVQDVWFPLPNHSRGVLNTPSWDAFGVQTARRMRGL